MTMQLNCNLDGIHSYCDPAKVKTGLPRKKLERSATVYLSVCLLALFQFTSDEKSP